MTERCPDVAEFGALAGLTSGDPRLNHVEQCPRCRGLLASYRSFLAGNPARADRAKEDFLAKFLDREIGSGESDGAVAEDAVESPAPIARRARQWWQSRALAPGMAAAAVVLLLLAWHPLELSRAVRPSSVMRSDARPAVASDLQLQSALTAQGDLNLAWSTVPGADRYEVVVYSAALEELAARDAGDTTNHVVAAAQWSAWREAPGPLIWRVRAFAAGDLKITSSPAVIVPATSP